MQDLSFESPSLVFSADSIVDTVREPLLVLSADLRVRKANRSFFRTFKVSPEETIEEALQKMKVAGLRLGFVIDDKSETIQGTITSYDIMGEKPMRYLQSMGFSDSGITHKDIQVKDIMEKVSDWVSVELKNVETTTVQSVLDAFQKTGRTHIPVLDKREGKEHHLSGLFSSSKVLRLTEFARRKMAKA